MLQTGRRVRFRYADFDALLAATAFGDPQPPPQDIWDGEILLPQLPGEA
jgi:hypothetical protein